MASLSLGVRRILLPLLLTPVALAFGLPVFTAFESSPVGLLRWRKSLITVSFVHDGNWSAQREASARKGIAEWTYVWGRSGIPSVAMVEGPADVLVRFVQKSSLEGDRVGKMGWISRGGEIRSATMYLAIDGGDNAVATAAHESGHMLGIVEHSSDPHDLMYQTPGDNSVTVNDIQALDRHYR